MSWSWSGAYDINATLLSAGSGVLSNISVDTLVIPSGHVTSPGTGAILAFAGVVQISGNAGLQTLGFTFVDANGVEQESIPAGQELGFIHGRVVDNDTDPWRGFFHPYEIQSSPREKYALPDTLLGSPGLSGGGTIRIKCSFINGSDEVLSGTFVAAIWDSTEPTERMRFDANGNNNPSPFSAGGFYPPTGSTNPTFYGYFENAAAACDAGIASGFNFAPSFTGSGWSTVIAHTSGQFWAGIGAYSGPGSDTVAVPFSLWFPAGTPSTFIEMPIVKDPPGTTARSYAQVIG